MTVIRHNSISGIVSITAAAGSNLSFYDSNGSNLSLDTGNINAGVITATTANFTNATVTGDLTVQGTTTTLDTTVTEVDKLEVGANNTTVGVAITQSGTGDILRLYDGATEVFSVVDGGNVAIGKTDPITYSGRKTLALYGGATSTGLLDFVNDSGSQAYLYATNNQLTIYANDNIADSVINLHSRGSSGSIQFRTNNNQERMRITSSGNVGIGTDNPLTKLDIHHNGTSTPTTGLAIGAKTIAVGGGSGIFLKSSNNTTVDRYGSRIHTIREATDNGASSLVISNENSSASSLVEVVRLTSDGTLRQTGILASLGQGTSLAKLTHYTIDPTTPGGVGDVTTLETTSTTSNGSDYRFRITKREGSGGGSCYFDLGGNSDGSISFGTNTSGSGTERLRITSSGQVAVNGGSPNANWGPFNVNVDGSNIMHIGYGANYDNYFTTSSSGTQIFRTSNTERFRIGPSGQIGLSGANYGTSGQVLTSQGSGSAPQWASVSAGFTSAGTALGMTGNANLTISSIPSSARQIVITLISAGPPTSQENDWLLMRVGTSSGVISSVIYAWNTSGGNNVNYSNGQAHVRLSGSWNNGSSTRQHGTIILNQFDANNWNSISLLGNTTQGDILVSGSATFGQSGLGTNLDRIFLFTGSGNPWTSGVVNLQYI